MDAATLSTRGQEAQLDKAQATSTANVRVERLERSERLERPERPERLERLERTERPERLERPERPERPERSERSERLRRCDSLADSEWIFVSARTVNRRDRNANLTEIDA